MKIAIVGTAVHCAAAPYADPAWEIWGTSNVTLPRFTRWFALQQASYLRSVPDYWAKLAAMTVPVMMKDVHADIPASAAYPRGEMIAKYGTWFFTSSVAWMLALAIEQKPDEIGLFGVDMATESEYGAQKAGCRFFLQIALMSGIKVTLPEESEVVVPGRLYGFEPEFSWIEMKANARKAELTARMAAFQGQLQHATLRLAALRGARDITIARDEIDRQITAAETDVHTLRESVLIVSGGLQDIEHIRTNWTGA